MMAKDATTDEKKQKFKEFYYQEGNSKHGSMTSLNNNSNPTKNLKLR